MPLGQRAWPCACSNAPVSATRRRVRACGGGGAAVQVVAAGNEAVLRARFEDASFFYREDLKLTLEQMRCVALYRALARREGHRAEERGARGVWVGLTLTLKSIGCTGRGQAGWQRVLSYNVRSPLLCTWACARSRRPKLSGTLFQKELGSLLDKAQRTEALVAPLAALTGYEQRHPGAPSPGAPYRAFLLHLALPWLWPTPPVKRAPWSPLQEAGLSPWPPRERAPRVHSAARCLLPSARLAGVTAVAQQAAHLAKADLVSSTVMEMTALAGTMGRHYAQKQGLPAPVSEAIFEACLPRQAGDLLPRSPAGVLVAVADRLDSLVGLFAAGCAPTATADQYGLRRAAYGMLQVRRRQCAPACDVRLRKRVLRSSERVGWEVVVVVRRRSCRPRRRAASRRRWRRRRRCSQSRSAARSRRRWWTTSRGGSSSSSPRRACRRRSVRSASGSGAGCSPR